MFLIASMLLGISIVAVRLGLYTLAAGSAAVGIFLTIATIRVELEEQMEKRHQEILRLFEKVVKNQKGEVK